MDMIYHVLSEDLLGLQTNVTGFRWSYGITPPVSTASEYGQCLVKLQFFVDDSLDTVPSPRSDAGKYHYFTGEPSRDAVEYARTFLGRKQLRLRAERLVAGIPALRVNRTYYRYVKHRFMNLHSPGYLLTDLASWALLRHGLAPLHCSAFCYGDATVVVLAPPNTGKTLTAMMACREHGARFLSEDLAITDGSHVFSVPWTSTFRYYGDVDRRLLGRTWNWITSRVPALELAGGVSPRPITDYLPSTAEIVSRSRVTHVVFLERGSTPFLATECPGEALRKARNLNRYEFNHLKSPLLVAYDFFNPGMRLDDSWESERRVLEHLVTNANHVLTVSAPQAIDYVPLILQAIDAVRVRPSRRPPALTLPTNRNAA